MKHKRKGNLVECSKPLFVTLTGIPANRSPFRVIRSDDYDQFKDRLRAGKISRVDSLISITLPSDATDDEITQIESVYGINEDTFTKGTSDSGAVQYTRRGDPVEGEQEEMLMPRGETITVVRRADLEAAPAKADPEEETKQEPEATVETEIGEEEAMGICIARLRFDPEYFTVDSALEWAESQGMGAFNVAIRGEVITLTQSAMTNVDELEFTSVVPAKGVLVDGCSVEETTKRSDSFETLMMTNECGVVPFGCYGWNANTFLEALADIEYSEKINQGVDLLNSVLHNIMKWQWQLTPSEAKSLMESSLDGAKWYFGNLLDALPQNAIQRSDLNIEDKNMPLTKEDKQEIAVIVAETLQSREDEAAKKQAEQAAEQQRADSEAALLKAQEDLAAEKQARADLEARLQKLEDKENGSSIESRSDEQEDPVVTDEPEEPTKRSDEDIWSGAFGTIHTADAE